MLTFYSTRLARQKFYLEKKFSSESSRVKFKNGIHSTRSSFHCFVSSEFRVLVEYFWRSIVIFMHLQKMFGPIVCNISVNFFFVKLKLIKRFYASIILKKRGRTTKQTFYLCHIVSIYKALKQFPQVQLRLNGLFQHVDNLQPGHVLD